MVIGVGDKIKTAFCTGNVIEVIDGKSRGWQPTAYIVIHVTQPRLHWTKRRQIIRIDEVKEKVKNGSETKRR